MIATLAARRVLQHALRPAASTAASAASALNAPTARNAPLVYRALASKASASATPAATPTSSSSSPSPAAPAAPDMTPKQCADDQIPSILDQATGLERAEIEYPDMFRHNEVIRGAFGTAENPVKIQSMYDQRIVGCTGQAVPDDHDIMWVLVQKGEQATCPECGQVFELEEI